MRTVLLVLPLVFGHLWAGMNYPQANSPYMQGLLQLAALQSLQEPADNDSLMQIDVNSPHYRYPGRAMMLSLVIPGSGQLYMKEPKKTVLFLTAEVAAILAWKHYNQRGIDQTQAFKDTADLQWNFRDWVDRAPLFAGWTDVTDIGVDGSHSLDYFVDRDGDGIPEIVGETKDARFLDLFYASDTTDYLSVKMNHEYYENIGKYEQFFSGWDDADPDNPDIRESKSGFIAHSPHRDQYLSMRDDANRFKSLASYSISALMFNHVLSSVDAIFSAARWNRKYATRVGGGLWFNPDQTAGIGGVHLSLTW